MQKPFEESVVLPIYGCKVFLNVSYSLKKAARANSYLAASYGDDSEEEVEGALHLQDNKGNFGVFYTYPLLTRGVIAHEIFHLTHFIIHHIGDEFDIKNHEVYAYLNHWLTDWVYMHLRNKKTLLVVDADTDVILLPLHKQRTKKKSKTNARPRTNIQKNKSGGDRHSNG